MLLEQLGESRHVSSRRKIRETHESRKCVYGRYSYKIGYEASLKSENLIVKIFAVLDRRVGKRRLRIMKETIMEEPDTFQEFYAIRAKAEGLL